MKSKLLQDKITVSISLIESVSVDKEMVFSKQIIIF